MSTTQDGTTPVTPNDEQKDVITFENFGLNKFLLQALHNKGYTQPTEIQEKTLEAFGEGKHIVGQSQTGTGKTAAFVLPVLNAIDTRLREPQVLILAPTRELAHQIRDEVFELSKFMYMKSMCAFGGSSKRRQIEQLGKGPQVVIGTVGRVKDLIDMGKFSTSSIKYFILDEVDRMLDMGFIDDIEAIRSRCINVQQALTYSATIPDELKGLLHHYMGDDFKRISVAPQKIVAAKVDHMFLDAPVIKKYSMLKWVLEQHEGQKAIIFAETKHMTRTIHEQLMDDGFSVIALHGDMEQRDRFQTLRMIKNNEIQILVATDVAARGLNMNNVDIVINFEVPRDPESYIHRIGRTGRAGAEGKAVMLVDKDEYKFLHAIEKRNKIKVKKVDHLRQELQRRDTQRSGFKSRSRYKRPGSGGYNKSGQQRGGRGGGGYKGKHGGDRRSSGGERRSYSGGGRSQSSSSRSGSTSRGYN